MRAGFDAHPAGDADGRDGFSAETMCRARVGEETFGARGRDARRDRLPVDARAAEAGGALLASTREAHSGSSAVAGVFHKNRRPGFVKPMQRETAGENPGDESRAPIRRPQPIEGRRAVKISQSATSVPPIQRARPHAPRSPRTAQSLAPLSTRQHHGGSFGDGFRGRRAASDGGGAGARRALRGPPHHRAADPFHGRCVSPALYGPPFSSPRGSRVRASPPRARAASDASHRARLVLFRAPQRRRTRASSARPVSRSGARVATQA